MFIRALAILILCGERVKKLNLQLCLNDYKDYMHITFLKNLHDSDGWISEEGIFLCFEERVEGRRSNTSSFIINVKDLDGLTDLIENLQMIHKEILDR